MLQYLLVALGGALGAVSRFAIGRASFSWYSHDWPWATFGVNTLGSFAIGLLYVLIAERGAVHADNRYLLMVGFLGAFTTFSTFALETVAMLEGGRWVLAVAYVTATIASCVLGCGLGILLMR
ncbi:fluoride efflux transporter CrcB [Litorivivens sp.]|uniref:fluoride efflux transporter CrcB n=2 Tax=Litorivivens sp. TaxID=2020868 RepID=UPI003568A90B